jgi:ligand-binding SRPBCC domain-containing protein
MGVVNTITLVEISAKSVFKSSYYLTRCQLLVIVETEMLIEAPIDICFDFARNIEVHTQTVWQHTKERAIEGITEGLISEGEIVTFQATHFLIRQELTSQITEFERPYYFVDEMKKGAFKNLRHEHIFEEQNGKTLMKDKLTFEAPFGIIGWFAERMILKGYMKRFLEHRNYQLKQLVEKHMEIRI